MELFDNTIILYDKDGNEVEFEFLHECKYQGKTYYVAWSEETDDKVVVTENSEGDVYKRQSVLMSKLRSRSNSNGLF